MLAWSSNENKISNGYRERASIEVEVFLSLDNVIAQRVAVRCIAWLDEKCGFTLRLGRGRAYFTMLPAILGLTAHLPVMRRRQAARPRRRARYRQHS